MNIHRKFEMHEEVLNLFLDRVKAEQIPVEVEIVKKETDYSGDIQAEVLVSYEESDEELFSEALNDAIHDLCLLNLQ